MAEETGLSLAFSKTPKTAFLATRPNYSSIFKFICLSGGLTDEETAEIIDHPNYNERKESDRELGGMLTETRDILQKFYRPFNEELASILEDKRFLWKGNK